MEQDAARYGIKYRKEPPYEVVSTAHMSEKELSALKRVEYALERVYHSGLFLNSFEYVSQGDPFQFLDRLSQFSLLHLCSEEDLAETIINYGISQGFALAGDMVKLDRLLKKNRPKVKFSPDGKEERRRELYKKLTLKNLPKGKRPWHYSRIEWFGFDVLAYLERKEIVPEESAFLFDYTGSEPVITKLID